MNRLRPISRMILADFRERTRRYSFLVTLGVSLFLGYLVFAGKFTLRLGDYCGEQNSAWTGTAMTMTGTLILVMFGFYLIKNAVRLDRRTGVGEILAATPMSKFSYIFAKFISNIAILSSMTAILTLSAIVMQLIWGIEGGFDLWDLVAPFLFVAIPAAIFVSSLAVLFESIRFLRGGIGNVVYFFGSMFTLPLAEETGNQLFDIWGIKLFQGSLLKALQAVFPEAKSNFILNPEYVPDLIRFPYHGVEWTLAMLEPKFFLIGLAMVVILPATLFFRRFDPAAERGGRVRKKAKVSIAVGSIESIRPSSPVPVFLESLESRFSFLHLLLAEIWLMVKGLPLIWYLVAGGLVAGQLAAPFGIVRSYILPIAWVWPLLIWSSMGTREARFGTDQIIFCAPRPLSRQLPTIWTAGVLIAASVGSGAAVRALLTGDMAFMSAWIVGVFFIPTLALALGCLSGTNRLFEIVYMVIWYLGPLNHLPALDFAGATDAAIQSGQPFNYFLITLALIPIAVLARRRRLIL